MATKKHCDICDKVVTANPELSRFGAGRSEPFDGDASVPLPVGVRPGNKMDLCIAHHHSLTATIKNWIAFEQGGFVNWPSERVTR